MVVNTIEDLSCITCIWAGGVDEDGLIECHRFPPEVHIIDGKLTQHRPRVSYNDFCGEHATLEQE